MTVLPQEFQSLIDSAETARNITGVPAKPVPCLNVVACGGPGMEKLSVTRNYADELLARKFISTKHVLIDCAIASSPGQLKRVLQTTIQQAANSGMVVFDNAHKLQDIPGAADALRIGKSSGAVIALVGERAGIEKLLRDNDGLGLQFPTIMDSDNRDAQRKQDELRQNVIDATTLTQDMKVGRPLQIRKPEILN